MFLFLSFPVEKLKTQHLQKLFRQSGIHRIYLCGEIPGLLIRNLDHVILIFAHQEGSSVIFLLYYFIHPH
jgi:hypothetical protein